MDGFEIMALDKDYNIVSLLRYTCLQWSRKFYESGLFSLEIPLEQYDPRFCYIYTKSRPEMGLITQVNYIVNQYYKAINISGYFLENLLNRRVVYKKPTTTNITNSPTWVNQSGKAEDVAYSYFNAFKTVNYTYGGKSIVSDLGISAGTSQHRGHVSDHERGNEKLGNKIYTILKPSRLSPRVAYDFLSSARKFEVWSGVDRTQDNPQRNNPIIFSTRYGNIKNPNVLMDVSEYKNCYIVDNTYLVDNKEYTVVEAGNERAAGERTVDDAFVYVQSSLMRDDYASMSAFTNGMLSEGHEELLNNTKTINVEFDSLESSYKYRVDFDLGDVCSVEIPEIALSCDAVLIGCYEVIKKGVNNLTLEFDTSDVISGGL